MCWNIQNYARHLHFKRKAREWDVFESSLVAEIVAYLLQSANPGKNVKIRNNDFLKVGREDLPIYQIGRAQYSKLNFVSISS